MTRVLVQTSPADAPEPSATVTLSSPWLIVRFAEEHEVLSWAVVNGGRRRARAVTWLEVKNADLPPQIDPRQLLGERLRGQGLADAVGLLTSRRLDRYVEARALSHSISAHAVATVGLSNAVRVGDPTGAAAPAAGTINVLCAVSARLSEEAALEALAVAAEARTTAVLEAGIASRFSPGRATGTGTDCLVLAWPPHGTPHQYAGKHTAVGQVVGGAVLEAVRTGVLAWLEEQRCRA
jgi:adenosylcobinamide amidohydrolase